MRRLNQTDSTELLERGLNRRAFLQQSGVASLVAGLMIYKPAIAQTLVADEDKTTATTGKFTSHQQAVLRAAQMQLFPADSDGPSAKDINALACLEWALTDPDNVEDGDRVFISKGIGWLEGLSRKYHADSFPRVSTEQQHQLLQRLSKSKVGENWISLLVYYLLEALLLDPVYGGNPDGIGWQWLKHQPGFPRPTTGHTYRHYLS